jgi:hypothetical protein
MITSNPYDGERAPGAVGHPLPGVKLRITDLETSVPLQTDKLARSRGPPRRNARRQAIEPRPPGVDRAIATHR